VLVTTTFAITERKNAKCSKAVIWCQRWG